MVERSFCSLDKASSELKATGYIEQLKRLRMLTVALLTFPLY